MLKLPKQLKQIKEYHTYSKHTTLSDWSAGLNKAGYVPKSPLDRLRNNMSNDDWAWVIIMITEQVEHLQKHSLQYPDSKAAEFYKACDNLADVIQYDIYVQGEFSDAIFNKQKNYKKLQTALWKLLMASAEVLEYSEYK